MILENKNKPHRYLLYIGQNYSFEILRPLQQELRNLNIEVVWFVSGNEVDMSLFQSDEKVFTLLADILKYNPTVTLVPGNEVLYFLPGIKVQVFHGLESKKKRRILLKGFYDLYCTCGKAHDEAPIVGIIISSGSDNKRVEVLVNGRQFWVSSKGLELIE